MFNRGLLKREIQKGLWEGKTSFIISHDGEFPDHYGKEEDRFAPVRIAKDNNDHKEGYLNFTDWHFKSKSGHASMNNGLLNFGAHSNQNFELRRKRK